MKRWTVMVMAAASVLWVRAPDASATWYHYIYGSAAEQGIYMWQAGCGSDGCEHHDCYEGVCYNRWGDHGFRGSGKVGGSDIECGIGPSEGVWCGIIHHTCRQPEPYNWAGFTDTHAFAMLNGSQDSGVLACAVGRCNGPDTAPDCGATTGGCTDRYWRFGATCSDGSCWDTYCSGHCGGVSWSAYWWDDTGGGDGGGDGGDGGPEEQLP